MLSIDFKNLLSPRIADGLKSEDLEALSPKLDDARASFLSEKNNLGFTKLPYNYELLKVHLEKISKLAEGMNNIVVIGIGGSDLGTRALIRALKSQYYNLTTENNQSRKIFFVGATTDPSAIAELEEVLVLPKTLFIVISKSGNTIEQASTFVYFRSLVKSKLGENEITKHFVFLTENDSGTLKQLSDKYGYQVIPVLSDVGGRFSVLSSVGMVPAHLFNLNVELFLQGAKDLDEQLSSVKENDVALKYAAIQYLYYKSGKNISVLMPYRYSLYEFSRWFRQLWAESLGKRLNNSGNEVFEGITPVAALGPTDQHSQLQLYNEGPNDKIITFINSKEFEKEVRLPEDFSGVEPFDFMKGRKFGELLEIEMQSTIFSLTKNNRPNCTITIDKLDEYHLGQLFYFFEVAVVYLGYLLDINPFDQPGVELSKDTMYGILGKHGFDKQKQDFNEFINL